MTRAEPLPGTAPFPHPSALEDAQNVPTYSRPDVVAASLRHCQRVARTQAGNFYHGLKLTPEPKRGALCAIYAYMRACDDCVDAEPGTGTPQSGPTDAANRLEA